MGRHMGGMGDEESPHKEEDGAWMAASTNTWLNPLQSEVGVFFQFNHCSLA